jgi:hypothetical protein
MCNFIDRDPSLETYWRAIVLLGRNVASYKFALAKALLEIRPQSSLLTLDELALPFALNICEHLKLNEKQATSASSQFLDHCRKFNLNEIDQETLREQTIRLGFVNVIDAFHNVAQAEVPRFFDDARRQERGIVLSDNFYKLLQSGQQDNLKLEVNSRWRLWETAMSLDINPRLIEIRTDPWSDTLFVLNDARRRVNVTSSREALNGYQKGKCFYCFRDIMIEPGHPNSCDVDHFFPHVLKGFGFSNLDQVWNLVLSCGGCNRGPGGKFERIPDISLLNKLHKRNSFFVESHHPLKETIINQTGATETDRRAFLQSFFNRAADAIPSKQKWKPRNPSGDVI